jgi:hypothetical protein
LTRPLVLSLFHLTTGALYPEDLVGTYNHCLYRREHGYIFHFRFSNVPFPKPSRSAAGGAPARVSH